MEQLLDGLSVEEATFVRKCAPGSLEEAATLAQQFSETRHHVDHHTVPQPQARLDGPKEEVVPVPTPSQI